MEKLSNLSREAVRWYADFFWK